uniref:CSON011155 protein n=1 Tax=Culicoides sonorensis TaxID=179676 RepID=A0A336M319_CULSO
MYKILNCFNNCYQKRYKKNEKIYDLISDTDCNSLIQIETDTDCSETDCKGSSTKTQSLSNLTSSSSTITALNKEKQRRLTFSEWNYSSTDKLLLAQIGFYFIGPTDLVKCYFCNVEIGMWQPDDNPVNEHLRWSQNCPLLQGPFFPCGHIIACAKCASSVTKCSYCNQPFVKVMRVYLS